LLAYLEDPDKYPKFEFSENLCVRQEGRKVWFKYPWSDETLPVGAKREAVENVGFVDITTTWSLPTAATVFHSVHAVSKTGLILEIVEFLREVSASLTQANEYRSDDNEAKSPFGGLTHQLELLRYIKNAFWSARPGANVRQWNPVNGDIYIANLFESDEVSAVYARWQDEEGFEFFSPVPKILYTINLARATELAGGPQTVTTIEFLRPLDTLKGQAWDKSQLYVTLTSSVSENTAAAIEYLLDTYTDLITDNSTFANVASALSNYPSHFTLSSRPDALAICQEIAWQARCALIVDGPSVKIKYLSAEPSSDFIINENKTLEHSAKVYFTPTEDIVTRLVGTWRRSYAPEPFDVAGTQVYENNMSLHGKRQQDYDFFIYNAASLVAKSLAFWGNRLSNTWRILTVQVFPEAYGLEVFDCVRAEYSTGLIGSASQKTIVESVNNNVHAGLVDLTLWTPAVAGTVTTQANAWLSDGEGLPDNPADLFEENDAAIYYGRKEIGVDEVMRELRKLETHSQTLGKITAVSPTEKNTYTVDYYGGGYLKDATQKGLIVVDTNPHHQLRVGDWIEVLRGQDGVHLCRRAIMRVYHGVVAENIRDENGLVTTPFYNVKIIDLSGDTISGLRYVPLMEKGGAGTPIGETLVAAFNLAEMAVQVFPNLSTGFVQDGEVVELYHSTSEYGNSLWWFNKPIMFLNVLTGCMMRMVSAPEAEEGGGFLTGPRLIHKQKITDGDSGLFTEADQAQQLATIDTDCAINHNVAISPKFEVDAALGLLRIFPQCVGFDYAGHLNFHDDSWVGEAEEGFDCGEPIEIDLSLLDRKVAASEGEASGFLNEVLTAVDPWISMTFVPGAIASYELEHTDPQLVNSANAIIADQAAFDIDTVVLSNISWHSDLKGHVNGETNLNFDFKIIGDNTWILLTGAPDAPDFVVTIGHMGPDVANEAWLYTFVGSLGTDFVSGEDTAKGTKLSWTLNNIAHDVKGHALENPHTEETVVDVYVPQMLKHLKDVSATLAPVLGDLLQFDGTEWVKVATVDVTVVTDIQVTTNKIQKKTRSIKVIVNGDESDWLDVHTGVECVGGS